VEKEACSAKGGGDYLKSHREKKKKTKGEGKIIPLRTRKKIFFEKEKRIEGTNYHTLASKKSFPRRGGEEGEKKEENKTKRKLGQKKPRQIHRQRGWIEGRKEGELSSWREGEENDKKRNLPDGGHWKRKKKLLEGRERATRGRKGSSYFTKGGETGPPPQKKKVLKKRKGYGDRIFRRGRKSPLKKESQEKSYDTEGGGEKGGKRGEYNGAKKRKGGAGDKGGKLRASEGKKNFFPRATGKPYEGEISSKKRKGGTTTFGGEGLF